MVDESSPVPPAPGQQPGQEAGPRSSSTDAGRCPWCSAVLPTPGADVCPVCQARLVEEQEVEIPGVTSVYPDLLASAAAPRKISRTFGALFVGDERCLPPSEAELPPGAARCRGAAESASRTGRPAGGAPFTLIESGGARRPCPWSPPRPGSAGGPARAVRRGVGGPPSRPPKVRRRRAARAARRRIARGAAAARRSHRRQPPAQPSRQRVSPPSPRPGIPASPVSLPDVEPPPAARRLLHPQL
jgi:hypothetical protein